MLQELANLDLLAIQRAKINNIINALTREETLNNNGPEFDFALITDDFNSCEITHASGLSTLEKISNCPNNAKFFIRPSATTVLTINDMNKAGVVAGANIKLNAETKEIDGANGGYIELQLRSDGNFYEVGFNDQYNS